MRKKDLEELKNKNLKQLYQVIGEKKKELTNDQIELKMGKIKNVHKVNHQRKVIAKINTILRSRTAIELEKKKGDTKHATS